MADSPKNIEFDVLLERVGRAEAIAWIDAKVESLREWIGKKPPPTKPTTSYESMQWQRMFMAHYGKVIGALETMQTFGILEIEHVKLLENQVKMMIQFHMGAVLIEGRGVIAL